MSLKGRTSLYPGFPSRMRLIVPVELKTDVFAVMTNFLMELATMVCVQHLSGSIGTKPWHASQPGPLRCASVPVATFEGTWTLGRPAHDHGQ